MWMRPSLACGLKGGLLVSEGKDIFAVLLGKENKNGVAWMRWSVEALELFKPFWNTLSDVMRTKIDREVSKWN
jgi:hypothetical protein